MNRPMLLLALVAAGCKGDPIEPDWDISPVYGIANIDDDNGDGDPDASGDLVEEENDLSAVVFDPLIWDLVEEGTVKLGLDGKNLRVYRDGALLLEDGDSAKIKAGDLIEVEFLETLAAGTLTLTARDEDGELIKKVDFAAMSGPLLLNHHMQEAELVVALLDPSGRDGNAAFVEGFEAVLGDRFQSFPMRDYQYDRWLQDEIEFGSMTSPDHRVDLVIDSIRNDNGRGLDNVAEDQFEAPDFARNTWGEGWANSQDSFGNMEVSPPVTVDGVEYPFGRIYWGEAFGSGPNDDALLAALQAQEAQAPFQLDVSFLCVGHVDEFVTFLPDTSAPKGFRLYITDTEVAYDFLGGLDPAFEIPLYGSDKGYNTVGDVLADKELAELNAEIQADYLEPAIVTLKAELGLDDDDIVRMPMLFETASHCGGTTAAFFPGTVNMTVATLPGESTTHVFMPDPFFRADTSLSDDARASDPFISYIEGILPPNVAPTWLDDWDSYHLLLGEVHCGSNTVRTPSDVAWWESAMHLIGGDQ